MLTIFLYALLLAQDAPAQPPAEQEVVVQFEAASRGLLDAWIARRPEALKLAALGRADGRGYSFTECVDVAPSMMVRYDVKKTDSILAPFIGVIHTTSSQSCTRRMVWPPLFVSSGDRYFLDGACVDRSYEQCLAARGQPPNPRHDRRLHLKRETTLTYRWVKGAWEFDQESERSRPTIQE